MEPSVSSAAKKGSCQFSHKWYHHVHIPQVKNARCLYYSKDSKANNCCYCCCQWFFYMKALHISEQAEKLPQPHGLFTQNATVAREIVFLGDLGNSYSQVNGQLEIEVQISCTGSPHRSTNQDQYCILHKEDKRNPCFRWKPSSRLEVKLHVIQKKELKRLKNRIVSDSLCVLIKSAQKFRKIHLF